MEGRKLFDIVTDHPKLAGFLAWVAIAITFTPKTSVAATVISLFAAWVFGVGMIAGLSVMKAQKFARLKILAASLALLICLLIFALWLPDKGGGTPMQSVVLIVLKREGNALLKSIGRPWAQRCLYTAFGMLLLTSIQSAKRIYNSRRKPKRVSLGTKGFLDYKLQAGEGMAGLTPVILDITKVVGRVSALFNSAQGRLRPHSTTQTRVREIGKIAESLRQYSSQLDSKCADLERNGEWVAEGTTGWLEWVSKQDGRRKVGQELEAHLRTFASTLLNNFGIMNDYLALIESGRGVSKEFNEVLDAHISSIRRIMNANEGIRKSCLHALQMIESF
jgi:hypothetical protein